MPILSTMMKLRLLTWFAAVLLPLTIRGQDAAPAQGSAPKAGGEVWVVPLKGDISPGQFQALRRSLNDANKAGASAIVVEINTHGGRIDAALDEMDALLGSKVPVIAYVNDKAVSAGALIALAAKRIYMHPNAVIGAAAVHDGNADGADTTLTEKAVSVIVAKARSAAAANGHPQDVAEAFVQKSAIVRRNDSTIDDTNTILVLNARDATKKYGDQSLLAAGIADNAEAVASQAGLKGALHRLEPSAPGQVSTASSPAPQPATARPAESTTATAPLVASVDVKSLEKETAPPAAPSASPSTQEPPKALRPGAPSPTEANPAKPAPWVIAKPDGDVWVIPVTGEVGPPQFFFLRRALKEAQKAGASAVILEIDTYGGHVDAAMDEMDALLASQVPTMAFVNTKAISAGSLISLATKRIYMHPNAVIGASLVVGGGGEDLAKDMSEKGTSMVVAKARGAAAANGHSEDIAEAFVRRESELRRGDTVLDNDKTVLTLNATDAARKFGDKPLFAAGIAENVEAVIKQAGLTGRLHKFEPSGFETLAFWITTLAPLLMIGGVVGAYIEMKAPGFGIPGICSLICFALFFGGHLLAGLAGWESIVVFAIGVALVLVELFVLPGTLIAGIMGVLLMLLSLMWAMIDHTPSGPDGSFTLPSGEQLEQPMINLLIAVVGTSIIVMILARILPKTSLYNRLVLSAAVPGGAAVTVPIVNLAVKVGDIGVANTTLRPAGKATFGNTLQDVVSVGTFITAGASVRVVDVDGTRVVVEQA